MQMIDAVSVATAFLGCAIGGVWAYRSQVRKPFRSEHEQEAFRQARAQPVQNALVVAFGSFVGIAVAHDLWAAFGGDSQPGQALIKYAFAGTIFAFQYRLITRRPLEKD